MPYLEHHGILGMKWGIRRFQNKDGSLTPLGKKRADNNSDSDDNSYLLSKRQLKKKNKDYKKDYKDASDNRRLLSDEELGYRINRLRQERELKRLTNESERPIRTMISEVAFNASKKVLSEIGAKTLMYGAKSIMKKEKMTLSGAAEYIFEKNKNRNRNSNTNSSNNEDEDDN